MDRATFSRWLNAYGEAWASRNPQAAAELFTEDGSYQVTPFHAPHCGRQAIFDYWLQVTRTEENIAFRFQILAVTPVYGIAHWWASFVIVPPGLNTQLNGIFVISLDAKGCCKSLREWWHKQQA